MKSIHEIEAGLELDSDEEILRARLDTANARIAELERVQGVLVGALEAAEQSLRYLGGTLHADRCAAALAAVQKPEGGDQNGGAEHG